MPPQSSHTNGHHTSSTATVQHLFPREKVCIQWAANTWSNLTWYFASEELKQQIITFCFQCLKQQIPSLFHKGAPTPCFQLHPTQIASPRCYTNFQLLTPTSYQPQPSTHHGYNPLSFYKGAYTTWQFYCHNFRYLFETYFVCLILCFGKHLGYVLQLRPTASWSRCKGVRL